MKYVLLALLWLTLGVSAYAQTPSVAEIGVDPTVTPERLYVLDKNNSWVAFGAFSAGGYQAINVASGAGPVKISNTNLNGSGIYYQTPSNCLTTTIDGISRNCTPATSSTTCSVGQLSQDANYTYVCTSANTWKRSALTGF